MDPEIKTEGSGSVDRKARKERTRILNIGKSKEDPRHNTKEELEENPSKHWDAQLQEFLKTLEDPQGRIDVPQGLEPKLWSGPKLSSMSPQGGMDTSKWSKEMWISQIEAHRLGTTQEDWNTFLDVAPGGKEKIGELAEETIRTEAKSHRFWTLSYEEAKGPQDFCQQLQDLCHEWLKPGENTKEQILDLVTLEQFLSALPLDMQDWLRKNDPKTCLCAVSLAEKFLLKKVETQTWEQEVIEISDEDIEIASKSSQLPSEPSKDEDFGLVKPKGDGNRNRSIGWLNEGDEPKLKNYKKTKPLRIFLEAAMKNDLLTFKENNGNSDDENDVGKGVGQLAQPQNVCPVLSDSAAEEEEEINNNGSGERVNQSLKMTTAENLDAEEKPFRCWHCGQTFRNSAHLLMHERIHVGERLYKCSHCGESERTHMGQMPDKCSHCGCIFRYHIHKGILVAKKLYVCSDCGKSCSQKSDLLKHQRTHTGEKPYRCSTCGENFQNGSNLKAHRRIHTGEKPYKCLHCGKCFTRSSQRRVHERIHTTLCSHCGKGFGWKSELAEHEKTHLAEDPLVCFACGKNFELSSELTEHVRTHKKKLLECLACGKTFTNRLQRLAHQTVHTREKPHKCSHCGKSFSQRQNLIVHERIHAGKKLRRRLAGVGNFRNAPNLKSYERIHAGEKKYRCSHCEKSFRWRSQLLLHKRVHTGEKTYPCSDCGITFDRRSELLRHVRSHKGQSRYACSDCGKSFISSSVLLQHRKVHVGEDIARCLECGKGFRQRKDQEEKVSKCPDCIQGPSLSSAHERAQRQLKEKKFECSVCGKTFKNSSYLMFHQSMHTNVRPRQCLVCGRNTIWRPNLLAPLKNLCRETAQSCSGCEKLLN
ncbi:zinc finger protein 271-like isoform X2 [Erythrolamprus reginae]|uniref:zinc finger protein 271-like isoform X2 n=1 Tax=Erythrolamprus reginae TaxID=121349 RepID=UPI00396C67CF